MKVTVSENNGASDQSKSPKDDLSIQCEKSDDTPSEINRNRSKKSNESIFNSELMSTLAAIMRYFIWILKIFCECLGKYRMMLNVISFWILKWLFNIIRRKLNKIYGKEKVSAPAIFTEGMNASKWLDEFDNYMVSQRYKDSHSKGKQLLALMDPATSKLFKKVCRIDDDKKKYDYTLMRNEMLQLFVSTKINQREMRLKFHSRVQQPDETIHRYYHELQEIVDEAYPMCDRKLKNIFIFQQILFGLNNNRIRNQLMHEYGSTTDLKEVLRIAKVQEEIEEMELMRMNSCIHNVDVRNSANVMKFQRVPSVPDLNRTVKFQDEQNQFQNSYNQKDEFPRNFLNRRESDNQMVCFGCKQLGHSYRDCKKASNYRKHNYEFSRNELVNKRNQHNNNDRHSQQNFNEGRPGQLNRIEPSYQRKNEVIDNSKRQSDPHKERTMNSRDTSLTRVNHVRSHHKFNQINKRNNREIRGMCSVNGKPVSFLVDTGASRSVISQKILEPCNERKPFEAQATTADGNELKIDGVQNCVVKIGESSYSTDVLVAPGLQTELLVGMDLLSNCLETKPHIEALRDSIDKASSDYMNGLIDLPLAKENNVINNVSFTLAISKTFTIQPVDNIKNQIEEMVKQIEAKGVDDLTLTN